MPLDGAIAIYSVLSFVFVTTKKNAEYRKRQKPTIVYCVSGNLKTVRSPVGKLVINIAKFSQAIYRGGDRERPYSSGGAPPPPAEPATRTVTMSRDPADSHGFGICVKGGKEAGQL